MDITASGTKPSHRGPAEWFTGTVSQGPVIEAPATAGGRAARVSFEQRASTAWHTHPLGQTLQVLTGVGHIRTRDGSVREPRPADTVSVSAMHHQALQLLND